MCYLVSINRNLKNVCSKSMLNFCIHSIAISIQNLYKSRERKVKRSEAYEAVNTSLWVFWFAEKNRHEMLISKHDTLLLYLVAFFGLDSLLSCILNENLWCNCM